MFWSQYRSYTDCSTVKILTGIRLLDRAMFNLDTETLTATANQQRYTTSIHQIHNLEAFVNHNAFGPVALVLDGAVW